MNNLITKITGEEILDSRGNKTISVCVYSDDLKACFSLPSGASTGSSEAFELRDSDGGMQNAISKIKDFIVPILVGKSVFEQKEIDKILINLDGTKNKSNLGGNAILGVSIACAKLGAILKNMPLYKYLREVYDINTINKIPYFYINLINGGKHAKNNLAFQEYHIVIMVENPKEALEIGILIQNLLKNYLESHLNISDLPIGDEGGFAPKLNNIKEPLYFLQKIIKDNNLDSKVRLALDVAATSFYEDGFYLVDDKKLNKEELLDLYKDLIQEFNLISIEDPFFEEDFQSFNLLKNAFKNVLIVGDDLTTTNKDLLNEAILKDSINAILIKPNQIGTLSETMDTIKLAQDNNIKIIISHRSGETMDDFIADLAMSSSAFGLKAGAPSKKERLIKYTKLIEISEK